MHGMVPHSEAVHRRPQAPSGPLPYARMKAPRHDQRDNVAGVGAHHRKSTLIGLVADVGEDEDNREGEECADGGQGVGFGAVEAESPN